MEIVKRFYTISELVQMGFSKYELNCATRIEGQTFATRPTAKRGSTWRFNLEAYMAFRQQQAAG